VPAEYARVRDEVKKQFAYAKLTGHYKMPLWSICLLYKKHNIKRAEEAIANFNKRGLFGDCCIDVALENYVGLQPYHPLERDQIYRNWKDTNDKSVKNF